LNLQVIRPDAVEDASAIGEIHVRARQAAYRDIMPSSFLDTLSATERAAGWERVLTLSGTTPFGSRRSTAMSPASREAVLRTVSPRGRCV
jgi:hypothetical protein